MICEACKYQVHEKCRGGTWCDCQHRAPRPLVLTMDQEVARAEGARPTLHGPIEDIVVDITDSEALDLLTQMAQEDGLGDHGPGL